jgi:hypothetical protein
VFALFQIERFQRGAVELAGGLQLFRALEIYERGLGLRAHAAVDAAGAEAAIVQDLLRLAHRLGVDEGRVRRGR